jgi:hypothetical protein
VPTTAEHLARVRQNVAFANSFNWDTTPYLDWVVTAYFYAAVHLVDALLYHKEKAHGDLHATRRNYIRSRSYLRAIDRNFEELKDHSEDARYRLLMMTRIRLENKVIPLYESIERHIKAQLP